MGELTWKGWIILSSLPHEVEYKQVTYCVFWTSLWKTGLWTTNICTQSHPLTRAIICLKNISAGNSVWQEDCHTLGFLLLILILGGHFPKKRQKKKKKREPWESFSSTELSVPFVHRMTDKNLGNMNSKVFLLKNILQLSLLLKPWS